MEGGGRIRVRIIPIKQVSVKSNNVLKWAGKPARDYLQSLSESEFKFEGASADAILDTLEKKTKPKSNKMQPSRRLTELCNYPADQERLIKDTIVSGVSSLRAYQKCIDTKELSIQDCTNICQAEDAIRMQVQECRPESVNSIQSAQTMIPINRLQP